MAWREALKKPTPKPSGPKPKFDSKDDDWETDTALDNASTEKSQRFGSSSVPGSGRVDHIDFKSIQEKVKNADNSIKASYQDKNPNKGYGGKYGKDQVMDKSATDFSYRADVAKHSSQTDGKKGFGGAHGVDDRAQDKSAVGFEYKAPVEKHSSQTDFSKGFGGKYGTDQNAQDKSAEGFGYKETVSKHSSQKDYSVGFGGKYGVQKEEPSKLAAPATPPSEPKAAAKPSPPVGGSAGVGNIRARFENMKKEQEEEAARRVAEERSKRVTDEQQQKPSSSNGHGQIKQQEVAPPRTAAREPSPPPAPRPASPTPASTPNLYQNMESSSVTHTSTAAEAKKQEPVKVVGGIDVSALLRQRKTSSSSSNHDDNEWADDHETKNQPQQQTTRRSPSPTPAAQSSTSNDNDGLKCLARYSYQKTEDDELGFEENEVITNVEKMHDDWWFGKIGSRSGLFPSNYVQEL